MKGIIECQICLEDKINNEFYIFCKGKHELNICIECVINYIKAKVEEDILNINCILPVCDKEIDVEYFLNSIFRNKKIKEKYKDIKKIYQDLKKKYQTPLIPCKSKKCDNIIKMSRKKEFTKCKKCNLKFCQYCKKNSHFFFGCKNKERIKINKLVNEGKIRFCPNCDISVERSTGCNIMNCAKCKKKFCWCCGDSIESKNFYDHCSKFNIFYCPGILDFDPCIAKRKQIFNILKFLNIFIFTIVGGIEIWKLSSFYRNVFFWVFKVFVSFICFYKFKLNFRLKFKHYLAFVFVDIFFLFKTIIFSFISILVMTIYFLLYYYSKSELGNFIRKFRIKSYLDL